MKCVEVVQGGMGNICFTINLKIWSLYEVWSGSGAGWKGKMKNEREMV